MFLFQYIGICLILFSWWIIFQLCVYHNWFSNSFIEGYLDYLLCKIFFSFLHKNHQWTYLNISWPVFMSISIVKFLELKSLGQVAYAFKNFLSIINLPSKKALPFYTPTSGIWEWAMFSFPRIWLEQFEDIHFSLFLLLQAPSQSLSLLMWLKGLVVLVGAKEEIQLKMSCSVVERTQNREWNTWFVGPSLWGIGQATSNWSNWLGICSLISEMQIIIATVHYRGCFEDQIGR